MPNQPENTHFDKTHQRINTFFIVFFVIVVSLFIGYIFIMIHDKNVSDKYDTEKELKKIGKSLDSLSNKYVELEKEGNQLINQIDNLKFEKDELFRRVTSSENKLATIKKGYEKISSYTGISVDSLHSIFSARFKR